MLELIRNSIININLKMVIPPWLNLLNRLRYQKPWHIWTCKKLGILPTLNLLILCCSENNSKCIDKRH